MIFNDKDKAQSGHLTNILDGVGAILAELNGSRYLPVSHLLNLLHTLETTYRDNYTHLQLHNVTQLTQNLKLLQELVQDAKYQEYLAQVKLLNKAKDKLRRSHRQMNIDVRN